MTINITTISENTASGDNLLAEWGLSILVTTEDTSILFDTGQGISASHNADTLGIDLSRIDKIVLSHGHFDHTGGLRSVLQKMKKQVEIIAHPDVWAAKYSRHGDGTERYRGIPFQRQELESLGASFNLTTKPVKINDNIMTTGEIPMTTDFEKIDPDLIIKTDDGWKQDELLDDQAMVIMTDAGLVVVLGCSHRGIINTLRYARQLTCIETIHVVLGGCHLYTADAERVRRTIEALKEMDILNAGLSHCTGLPAATLIAAEFGGRFFFNNAGTMINIE